MNYKHIATVVAVLALIAGLAIASVHHYDGWHKTQLSADQRAAQQVQDTKTALIKSHVTQEKITDAYDAMRTECLKGYDAWTALPAATKKLKVAPNCGLQIAD